MQPNQGREQLRCSHNTVKPPAAKALCRYRTPKHEEGMFDLVLATKNKGKANEILTLLHEFNVRVHTLEEFPGIGEIPETGVTFEENALIKARAVARATGMTALADDSGLEVDALDKAPGVYSARFSGLNATDAQNNDKLLQCLADIPWERRQARFVCVIAVHAPWAEGQELLAHGHWPGRIALTLKGEHGFGYDPLFLDEKSGLTAAEMPPDQKNTRSHRAAALRRLAALWPDFLKKIAATP